jgi:two-component system, response regulator PdtaR
LREAGYSVGSADSGESALAFAANNKVDLAVLDMRMPGMGGLETMRRLHADHGVASIFLSAFEDLDLVRKAVAEGAMGYVVKPVDTPQLVPAVEAALARSRDVASLSQAKANLQTALNLGRRTSIAVGILMERRRLTERAAFEALRASARGHRRKVEDLASEWVTSLDRINDI